MVDDKINRIVRKIVSDFEPEKIILFGSRVWGKSDNDSDIDLLVIKNTPEPKRACQIRLRKLLVNEDAAVDTLVYTPQEINDRLKKGNYFVSEVITKGKIVYGR